MLTKKEWGFIKSLQCKKERKAQGCFVVTGENAVMMFLGAGCNVRYLLVTPLLMKKYEHLVAYGDVLHVVCQEIITRVSSLKEPGGILLVTNCLAFSLVYPKVGRKVLVLDDIRDPGNMGTIIRTAHWFGIEDVVASLTSVDCYNPKVVQATAGSLCCVRVHYTDLSIYLDRVCQAKMPVIGAVLDGVNIHTCPLPDEGCLVMGNEAYGIGEGIRQYLTMKVRIPGYGSAESLNVGVAMGILLNRWCVVA